MSRAYVNDAPPLIDLGDCHDIFLSGVARIEPLTGNCLRFVCYVDETEGGSARRTVVLKVIWPVDALPFVLRQAAQALTGTGCALVADDGELNLTH